MGKVPAAQVQIPSVVSPVLGKQISEACWPAHLAEMTSSRFSEPLSPELGDGVTEMAQWLRAVAAPAEDPGPVSSTHTVAHTIYNSRSGGCGTLFGPPQEVHMNGTQT